VLKYEHRNSDNSWSVRARTRTKQETASTVFDMLAGETPLESGDRRPIFSRPARAFTAPFQSPDSKAIQSLWIDTESMRPLRWSVTMPGEPDRGISAIPEFGASLTYDTSPNLRVPPGITTPDCVRSGSFAWLIRRHAVEVQHRLKGVPLLASPFSECRIHVVQCSVADSDHFVARPT
jgi:hypothetical protein